MPRTKKPESTPQPTFRKWLQDGIGLLNVDEPTKERFRKGTDQTIDTIADGMNRFEKATNDLETNIKQGFQDFRKRHFEK